jgi:putative hydrolase of the HAD superfamily
MKKYAAVIFDVGGTLVRWAGDSHFARFLGHYAKAAKPHHLAEDAVLLRQVMIDTFARHRPSAVGMGATEDTILAFWRMVLEETLEEWQRPGYSDQMLARLTHSVVMGDFDVPFDDAEETLSRLSLTGYRLGVISNWNQNLPIELANWGLDRFFDFLVVSSLVGVAKPSPEIFWLGLRQAGCQACEALYVGDNVQDDCVGAQAAGMDVALIRRAAASQEEALCTAVYPSLASLADALLAEEGSG